MNAEELELLTNGEAPLHAVSESRMLLDGLEIEEQQYVHHVGLVIKKLNTFKQVYFAHSV